MVMIRRNKIVICIIACILIFFGVCVHKGIDSTGKLFYSIVNKYADNQAVDDYFLKRYPIEDKFWLHRTNTPEKLVTKGLRYNGVELDITYYDKENNFDNSHDEAKKIDFPLSKMFDILGHNKQKIWLDYKNLTKDNSQKSLERLEELLNYYGVDKKRCIVESRNYQDLKLFHDHGFYTSFYAPVDKKYLKNPNEQVKYKEKIMEAVETGNVDAVSFPIEYYSLVKDINTDKDMLLWDTGSKWWAFFVDPSRNAIRQNENVKVILVKDYAEVEH